MKKTFLITFKAYNASGVIIKEGTFKCKNQVNELGAKCNFESYLEKKYPGFSTLVITECKEDIIGAFENMFGMNSSNPFSGKGGQDFGNLFKNFGK